MADREGLVVHALEVHGDAVMRLALSQTLNAADAEDVVQDVFLRLISRAPSFASEQHLEAWLMRVTVNRCRDLFRARARHRATSIDELPFDPPCPDDAVARERLQAAWDALAKLTDDERAIVHLVCFEEKTYREAAGALGVSENTVRMRLHRIREKLRAARDEGERAADRAIMMKEAQR